MARATVNISLDAELVVEVMVMSGIRNAQDAIEVIVRDYLEKGHRTDAVTGDVQTFHKPQAQPRDHDHGGG
jgi:Arc/MetJ family transcription regulator